jgi:hypothetical protein
VLDYDQGSPFGQLVQLGRLNELDALLSRALKQSLTLIVMMAGTCFAAVLAIQKVSPRIAARMEAPSVFVLLLLTAICTFVIQGLAVYLRSYKREPYLVQSIVVAVLSLAGAGLGAPRWGSIAVALVYFLFSGVAGLVWALATFFAARKRQFVQEDSRGSELTGCSSNLTFSSR